MSGVDVENSNVKNDVKKPENRDFKTMFEDFVKDKTLSKEEAQILVDKYNKNRWQIIKITQEELKEAVKDIQVSIWAKVDIEKVWVWEDTITKLEAYIKDDSKRDITNVWANSNGEKLSGIEGGLKQLQEIQKELERKITFDWKEIDNKWAKDNFNKVIKELQVIWVLGKNENYNITQIEIIIKVLENKKGEIWKINEEEVTDIQRTKELILGWNIEMKKEIRSINEYISEINKILKWRPNVKLDTKLNINTEPNSFLQNKTLSNLLGEINISRGNWDNKINVEYTIDPRWNDSYESKDKYNFLFEANNKIEDFMTRLKWSVVSSYKSAILNSLKEKGLEDTIMEKIKAIDLKIKVIDLKK